MRLPSKRISFYLLAAFVGAGTFGVVWLPNAMAALYCNPSGGATMCWKGTTVNNVPPFLQKTYLGQGGTCGACNKPPTSPVNGP